ncbi:zf-HC2 domain-containing protein [Moorellaceae bacterium AZ2]
MKCRQAKKILSPYIDGELSEAERAALEEHLGSCEACRSEVEALKNISEDLKGIYQEVKAPPDFVDKVMKRIQELEEGKSSRLFQDALPGRPKRWLRVALVGVLVAGVGLGALQYGRTHVGGPLVGAGSYKPATPGTGVIAEKDEGVLPATEVSEGEKAQAPDKDGSTGKVGQPPAQGEGGKAAKEETVQDRTPATVEEKKPGNASPGQGTGEQAKTGTQVAAGRDTGSDQPRAFLSRRRHVRTTWVKVEVDDLASAKVAVAAAAARAGASGLTELWNYQGKETILKGVLPSGAAGEFLDRVAALGTVLEHKQETQDIRAEFDNKVLEYQVLAAKADEESRAMARALERHLEELDGQTLEAGKEVVNVWLKVRQPD